MVTDVFKTLWNDSYTKMPGHWLLATMGKRVLRPGGLELSNWMVRGLQIGEKDDVVELAPGLGRTAELVLKNKPLSYTGIERSKEARALALKVVSGPGRKVLIGNAEETNLSDSCATVVYGEAFLTMQSQPVREKIIQEIARILKPGGRYGLHELSLTMDSSEFAAEIHHDLSKCIRVNARPASVREWRDLLEGAGLEVVETHTVPMALLELKRMISDEGVLRTIRIVKNLLSHPSALGRVYQMRKQFRKHASVMGAVGIIARKK